MKETVVAFWRTQFEDTMYEAYGTNYERKSLLGDPRKWEKKTKKQPGWVPNGRSMKEFHLRLGKFSSVAHIRDGRVDEDFDEYGDGY
jgi:nitrate reductase beta subunit